MPARFSHLASEMQYKATRRVKKENLKMRSVAAFVALAMMAFLVVVRPTLRSNALSSRVGHRQDKLSSLRRSKVGLARRGQLMHTTPTPLLCPASRRWLPGVKDAPVIASPPERERNPSCSIRRISERRWPLLLRTPLPRTRHILLSSSRSLTASISGTATRGSCPEKNGANLPCEFTADQERFNDSSALAGAFLIFGFIFHVVFRRIRGRL